MDGLLLVDKPAGLTSHDVVARVRRWSGERRIGHAGTLDPLATGLLLLLLGRATRLTPYLIGETKRYVAGIRLGTTTTTDDAEGDIVSTAPVTLDEATIRATLLSFLGEQEQVPPAFSAIKQEGVPLYRKARRGEAVSAPPRKVTFYALELLAWTPPDALVDVTCSAGTYIRSLARDLGARLGCGGHIVTLRRLAAGRFGVEAALPLDQVEALAQTGALETALLSPVAALEHIPPFTLNEEQTRAVRHGMRLSLPHAPETPMLRALGPDGRWLALLVSAGEELWQPELVWEPA